MPDTDESALSRCTRCQRDVADLSPSGLCPECTEAVLIENVEIQSQRHRENPVEKP
jgi:rRNA maturation endonuclease Nob1